MVSSRLDYCNFLLYGASKGSVAKLQKVQNATLFCFLIGQNESCQTLPRKTPLVSHFISYYVQIQPPYFQSKKPLRIPYLASLIKSSSVTHGNRLSVSSVHPRKAKGRCGFAIAALVEWNRHPFSVRLQQNISSFRSQLKTYLYRLAYPHILTYSATCKNEKKIPFTGLAS